MGSETSKLKSSPTKSRTSVDRGSGTPTQNAFLPAIRIANSVSCNENFFGDSPRNEPDRLEISRSRSGSASSTRGGRQKHPVPVKCRQLIQSCFLNPHEAIGRKILKRACDQKSEFRRFFSALDPDQREDVEEQIKVFLKKTVVNIDFVDEVERLSMEFGERWVEWRPLGFRPDFFAVLADATIRECSHLDNAFHRAHQTSSAFSQFGDFVFSCVREGFYCEVRRKRRASNSFSTGSNSSFCRRKKQSIDITGSPCPRASLRSLSPATDSDDFQMTEEKEVVTVADDGFLKPPPMQMLTTRSLC